MVGGRYKYDDHQPTPSSAVVIEMNTSDYNFRAASGMIIHCLLEKTCALNYALVVK